MHAPFFLGQEKQLTVLTERPLVFCMHEYRVHAKSNSKVISGGQGTEVCSSVMLLARHRSAVVSADGVASLNHCSYQDDTCYHVERQKRGEGLVSACASD